jgi:peptidoglycan/LPS O-acetylase OafA/YrhL
MQPHYLPNLNALRAVSVIVVIISHASMLQTEFGGYRYTEWMLIPSKYGVIMFFCLSGILITHLILRDREFGIRQFYWRRVLRIWPLYFLVVILALTINWLLVGHSFHAELEPVDYLFYLMLLPQYAWSRPPLMGQTWSIGVEDVFYAAYPLMLLVLSRRLLVIALVAVVLMPELSALLSRPICGPCRSMVVATNFSIFYSTIAIGCMTYLAYDAGGEEVRRLLFSRTTQWGTFVAVATLTLFAIAMGNDSYFDWRLVALAFSLLILNAGFNPNSILQAENRVTRFLGEISYGMYMYHVFCIVLALLICWLFFKGETFPFQHLIVDTLSLTFTVIVSKLSYDWIETPSRAWGRKPA